MITDGLYDTVATESKPNTSYWLGDLVDKIGDSFSRAQSLTDAEGRWSVEAFKDTKTHLDTILKLLRGASLSSDMVEDEPLGEAAALVKHWTHLSAEPATKVMQSVSSQRCFIPTFNLF
jgi:hypothetical protein